MDAMDIFDVMKTVLENIHGERLNWRMDGSANLLVQGIGIKPSDIDITTDEDSYGIFNKAVKKYSSTALPYEPIRNIRQLGPHRESQI